MAQRDYVARSQKKRPAEKKQTKTGKFPWFRVLIAFFLLGCFATGLWHLMTKSAGISKAPSGSVNHKTPNSTSTENENTLPTLQEEEWAFIESLPNHSVDVDVEQLAQSDQKYLMQCGSFRSAAQAETLKAQIAFQGLESQVLKSDGSQGVWHRVVLGPFDRKREAERQRHRLRTANINNCKIWRWN